ncbi:MAG: hypothetical protein CMB78_06640 [Euryarchaeota archaeon]|nr:hypothetical protein [Euryarchaeota archaeon]MBF93430.1 hypothetical protein [Euryarchaeota archaeon]
MTGAQLLDDFLESQPNGIHKSHRKLAKLVREAYPIGVPALIMKSSTDRLGASAGYSFHLGTPDDLLRRIASWLFTMAGERQVVLRRLIPALWNRHGREDVALAALILANLDHKMLETNPWEILASSINDTEPAEALLLSIEEILRAGHSKPSMQQLRGWCGGRLVESHLALISVFASSKQGVSIEDEAVALLTSVEIPNEDSLLSRIRDRIASEAP